MMRNVCAAIEALIERHIFWDRGNDFACALISYPDEPERVGPGAGYCVDNDDPAAWPDGARLLTIGRVTIAAWGGRPS